MIRNKNKYKFIDNGPVKPYQAKNMVDYNKRTQMYNDSLAAHNITESFLGDVKKMKIEDTYFEDVYERHAKYRHDIDKYSKSLGSSKERIPFGMGDVLRGSWTVGARPKPKQEVLKPASIKKMPVMQPKKIATPEKGLAERAVPKYNPPTITSVGKTNPKHPKYATVNRYDKKGYVYLNKQEYDVEMMNFKQKKK